MKRRNSAWVMVLILILALSGCNKKSASGPDDKKVSCGEGEGYTVEFCRQVDNYTAGYGVPGEDYILVSCIVGPEGATVSNQKNGTYYCSGIYRLSSYSFGEISLNWGGSTSYSYYQEHEINVAGEGTFNIKVTKTSGGSGNIFLSMSSGSKWMFDTVLVNVNCAAAAEKSLDKIELDDESVGTKEEDGKIEKSVNRIYFPRNQ